MADETILRATLDTSGFSAGELKLLVSIQNINQAIDGSGSKFSEHEKRLNSLQGAAETLAGALAALTASFTVDKLVATNAEYDRLSTQLYTVTGSAEAAKVSLNSLIQFANTSPYQLSQVTEAFVTLRNAGLDSSTAMLTSLSNVASGMGRPIGDITSALASAVVGNTEALRSFGIEAQAAGDKFIVTFQGVSQSVQRNGPALEKYIAGLGNGAFAGDTARQSQTISGLSSTYEDSIQNLLRAVGDGGFNDAFKGLIADGTTANNQMITLAGNIGGVLGKAITDGRALWKDYGTEIDGAAVAIGAVIAAGTGLAAVESALVLITAVVNPWSVIIGGAAAALFIFRDSTIEVAGQAEKPIDAIRDAWAGVKIEISSASTAVDKFLADHPVIAAPGTILNALNGQVQTWGQDAHNAVFGGGTPSIVQTTLDAGHAANAAAAASAPAASTAAPAVNPLAFLGNRASQIMPYLSMIQDMAAATPGSPPWQVLAWQISQESSGDARAGLGTQHVGLGQFSYATGAQYGLIANGQDLRTDPGASIAATTMYDADLGRRSKGDWRTALGTGGYGTIGTPGAEAGFASAMNAAQPGYQLLNQSIANPQAIGTIATLQSSIGTATETGLRAAIDKVLIGANFSTGDASGVQHALTRDQLVSRQGQGSASLSDVSSYDKLTGLATQQYTAGIQQKQALTDVSLASADYTNSLISQGKQAELTAISQATLKKSLADGVPPLLAQKDAAQALRAAQQGLAQQAALGIANTNLGTGQSAALNRSVAGQGIIFDPNTNTYQLDTRQTDALKAYQGIDPYGVLAGSQKNAALASASGSANAAFDLNRTNEAKARQLTQTSNSDPTAGLKVGWQSYYDDVTNINKGVATLFTDSMSGMNDALVNFVKTGKMSWGSLFTTISTDLANLAIKAAESQIFSAIGVGTGGSSVTGGSILNSIGGFLGLGGLSAGSASGAVAGAGGWASIPTNNAVGGVYGGGLGAYANSVVSSPTYFAGSNNGGQRFASGTADLMGEAGPEAIIPLKRGADGSLGVRVSGAGGGGGGDVIVGGVVINNPQVDGGGSMSPQMAAQLQKQVGQQVQAGVMKVLSNQQRPGGSLYGAGRR